MLSTSFFSALSEFFYHVYVNCSHPYMKYLPNHECIPINMEMLQCMLALVSRKNILCI